MFDRKSWIRDTVASCFINYDDTHIYDVKKINEETVGISGNMTTTKLEKIMGQVTQDNIQS